MKRQSAARALNGVSLGFSLVEVVLALGIASFSLVAMLGLFPVGLRENAASVHESRGARLAQAVFAALRTPPFTAVDCFGTTLDLSSLDEEDGPVTLQARFPAGEWPEISAAPGADPLYAIELRFHKVPGVAANRVTVSILPRNRGEGASRFASIVGNY